MNGGFRASDGYVLHYRHWTPRGTPRGCILALHGIQSHAGWYSHSSSRLAEAGYEVWFVDRRGSGLNRCSRGHAIHAERLINDVLQFTRHVQCERPGIPTCLMGVSWGGRLAATVALRRPEVYSGLALLYPGLVSIAQPRWRDVLALRIVQARSWGREKVTIPLNDPALFTDDLKWQEYMRRDELSLYKVTVDFLLANLELGRQLEAATSLRIPSLLMLAGRDAIINNQATRLWYERVAQEPRRVIVYPDARHTLEFEPQPGQFINDLLEWLQQVGVKSGQAAQGGVHSSI